MNKKYQTIYVDPPWIYGKWGKGSDKCAMANSSANVDTPLPYPAMSIEEISSLPIISLASENCELYLWTTQKYLPFSFDIIKAWGFKYCQTLTWCKIPMGTGQGGLFTPTTEFLLLGRKGKMPIRERINTTWFEVKRQSRHSKKPDFFRQLIEGLSDGPRVELFARDKVRDWDVWGNEVESDITI
jgi:N6-adenosine-specific RNA methylase IME4